MKLSDLIGKLGDRIEFVAGMEIDKPTMTPYAQSMTVGDSLKPNLD